MPFSRWRTVAGDLSAWAAGLGRLDGEELDRATPSPFAVIEKHMTAVGENFTFR